MNINIYHKESMYTFLLITLTQVAEDPETGIEGLEGGQPDLLGWTQGERCLALMNHLCYYLLYCGTDVFT
jgi:hypothetical protein